MDLGNSFSLTGTDRSAVAREVQALPYRAPEVRPGRAGPVHMPAHALHLLHGLSDSRRGHMGSFAPSLPLSPPAAGPAEIAGVWRRQHIRLLYLVAAGVAAGEQKPGCRHPCHPCCPGGPQAALGLPYGAPIDMFSLGVVLAEMALKRALFPCATPRDLLCQVGAVPACLLTTAAWQAAKRQAKPGCRRAPARAWVPRSLMLVRFWCMLMSAEAPAARAASPADGFAAGPAA